MLRKTLLPTFSAIAAGSAATVDLPKGRRYHAVHLEFSDNGVMSTGNENDLDATLAAMVGDITVKINGHAQRIHTAVQLNQINGSNGPEYLARGEGTAGTAAYRLRLTIYFAEPWRKSNVEADLPAWNIDGGQESFQIEVKFNSGIVTPNVTGFYEWEPIGDRRLSAVTKVFRQSFGAVGTQNDFSLKLTGGFLQAIHLFPVSDGKFVNKIKLTANGADVQDLLTTGQNSFLLATRGLNPDFGLVPRFDLQMDYGDPLNSSLPLDGLSDLTLQAQYSASASGSLPALFVVAGRPE